MFGILLLVLAIVMAAVLVAGAIVLVDSHFRDRHDLDVLAQRLAAEQRIDHVTRATLRAMRDEAGRES